MFRQSRLLLTSGAAALASHAVVPFIWKPAEDPLSPREQSLKLRKVVLITRHGDRAPISDSLGEVWKLDGERLSFWKARLPLKSDVEEVMTLSPARPDAPSRDAQRTPLSMLTQRGLDEAKLMGHMLRQLYVERHGLLPEVLDGKLMSARSTNFERTRQTAAGILSGLYPAWARTDASPVISISTVSPELEILYPNADRNCKFLTAHIKAMTLEPLEGLDADKLEQDLLTAFRYSNDRVRWTQAKSTLGCLAAHGYPLPGGMTAERLADLSRYVSHRWHSWYAPPLMARLSLGRVVGEVMNSMLATVSGEDAVRFQLMAGHDTTIIPLLTAFAVTDEDGKPYRSWPPYMANLIVELWEDESVPASPTSPSRFHVRLRYNGRVVAYEDGDDDGFVPFSAFRRAVSQFIPTSHKQECKDALAALKARLEAEAEAE
eukprot:PLAT9862.1.p1 GENE.PLAT9862.1~~PLAT9862.1.p1  ORF type:complete len:441 (-),score=97.17 PLAT9862.1:97-1395(-)